MRIPQRAVDAVKGIIRKRLLRGRFRSTSFAWSAVNGGEARVVACLWNRPTRLLDVLTMLDAQDHPDGVTLYLWNNNKLDHAHYLGVLEEFRAKGALRAAEIVKTPFNLGSIARFYWVRKLAEGGETGPAMILDDDENIQPSFVSIALERYRPRTISAFWAFNIGASYWERTFAEVDGPVDHIGPGGSVFDSEIFLDDSFFTDIPAKYWMLDDLWISYWAPLHGYALAKLPVEIEFVMDETNMTYGVADLKPEFYRYLRQ